MMITTSVQDLLLLIWKRKLLIIGITLLIGLASVPIAQSQYEYVRQNYEESIIRTKSSQGYVVEDQICFMTAYVSIGISGSVRNIPGNDIIYFLNSTQTKYSAKLNTLIVLQMENNANSHKYIDGILDGLEIDFLNGLGTIIISNEAVQENAFVALIECLLQETKKIPDFDRNYKLTVDYDSIPSSAIKNEAAVDNYMTLPQRPDNNIRIIGTALVYGFALVCAVVLIADFARPVIKGIRDASNNFQTQTTDKKSLVELSKGKSCAFFAAGKIMRWDKCLEAFKKSGVSISESEQADLIVVCVKAFSTTYERAAKALQDKPDDSRILVVL